MELNKLAIEIERLLTEYGGTEEIVPCSILLQFGINDNYQLHEWSGKNYDKVGPGIRIIKIQTESEKLTLGLSSDDKVNKDIIRLQVLNNDRFLRATHRVVSGIFSKYAKIRYGIVYRILEAKLEFKFNALLTKIKN